MTTSYVTMLHTPSAVAVLISLVNLPFGWWRASVRKLSRPWFVAVHVPVALAIARRIAMGIPLRLVTLPLFVVAFATGQFLGGKLRGLLAT